jgi:hypothetical protein
LEAGKSYTLRVKLRAPKWAGSNIYWVKTGTYNNGSGDAGDVGYLTFDQHYVNGNDAPHKGYQGVFFKWGSLVGISPAETEVPGSPGTMTVEFLPTTPVYIPTYGGVGTSTWKSPNTSSYTSAGWGESANVAETIPYLGASYGSDTDGRSSIFVSEDARNNAISYQGLRGDICRYLSTETGVVSGAYRLPTSYEFGTIEAYWNVSAPVAGGWVKGAAFTEDNTAGNAQGTTLITNKGLGFVVNQTMGNVVFPASGYRNYDFGPVYRVGDIVLYWSSSSHNNSTGGYNLRCEDNDMDPGSSYYRSHAFPVRCVMND